MSDEETLRPLPNFVISDYLPIALPDSGSQKNWEGVGIDDSEITSTAFNVEKFRRATVLYPENAVAWFNRGRALFDAENYSFAAASFFRAMKENPNDVRFADAYLIAEFCIGHFESDFESHSTKVAVSGYEELLNRFGDESDPSRRKHVETALRNRDLMLQELAARQPVVPISLGQVGLIKDERKELSDDKQQELFNDILDLSGRIQGPDDEKIAEHVNLLNRYSKASESMIREEAANSLLDRGVKHATLAYYESAINAFNRAIGGEALNEYEAMKQLLVKLLFGRGLALADLGRRELSLGHSKEAWTLLRHGAATKQIVEKYFEDHMLEYYSLFQEEKNPSNGYELSKRAITEEQLREYIKEQAALLTERLSQPEEQPFPILSDRTVKAIIAHGKKHPWDERKKRGWPYHTNAFVYVHITYRKWVNRGLTREILAWADPALHAHLNTKISREGSMPMWLDVPSGPEARARAIADPTERAELEIARKFSRKRMRAFRANQGD